MNSDDYSVKIHCPIANAEETVFFRLVENVEGVTLYKDLFNGCDHNYSDCRNAQHARMPHLIL